MKIKELNELLESPEIKEVLEAAIQEQCKEKQDLLDKKIKELDETKKANEKELFINKQMLLSKANLYETKLKDVYETKFKELSKKVSTDVFNFISESINTLTKSVVDEAATSSKVEKIQEAFSAAVRIMSPYFNINELAEANMETLEKYKQKLNSSELENMKLREKVLSDELEAVVVKECTGYPLEKKTVIVKALKEAKPKTIVEAIEAINAIKASIRESATTSTTPVTEAKKLDIPTATNTVKDIKSSLIVLAEDAKKRDKDKKATITKTAGSIEPLDIF